MKEQVLENMNEFSVRVQKSLLGFASGVMVAASVWSLLIPAMEMGADNGKWSVVPATVGFLLGIGFLLALDELTPHLHVGSDTPEGPRSRLSRTAMTRRPPFQTVANSHAGTGCHHS